MILPAFIVLSIFDYMEGDKLENIINVAVILVMSAGIIILKRCEYDAEIYRITHLLIVFLLIYCVFIGAGQGTVLYWLFIMPILFFFFFGKKEGLIWVLAFTFLLLLVLLLGRYIQGYIYSYDVLIKFIIAFSVNIVVSYGLESSRFTMSTLLNHRSQDLLQEKERLEQALKQIKTLSGLIPICAHCKKVRNDQGYWQQVETYVKDHSSADFSHSICPDCFKTYYPDYVDDDSSGDQEE